MQKSYKWSGAKPIPMIITFVFFVVFWFIPAPEGLTDKAWHLLVIFMSTILSLIIKPLPMGGMAIMAAAVVAITKTLPLGQVLASFGSPIVWLIVSAFLLARGFIKTGLGARIAYYFISFLGKNTIGLAYGLTITELIFAPATPSNTARGAGIVYPIITGLNKEYGSSPNDGTARKVGSYLITLLFQVNVITSAMFLTATAGNPLVVSIAADFGVELSWGIWALACFFPGLVNLILLPLFLYVVYPPDLKKTPDAPTFARNKLKELGPLKVEEIFMIIVFFFLLILWVLGHHIGVDATVAGMCGLSILLLTGVLTWNDIVQEKGAWDTFIWMAVLIMLSAKLAQTGITSWFGDHIKSVISGMSWISVAVLIGLFYYYAHYFFASMTAHISALLATFLATCVAAGVPPMAIALFLGVFSSLSAGLTHYGTGSAPVYFGSGYVGIGNWWKFGFIVSVFNIIIWVTVGGVWWKVLGYW